MDRDQAQEHATAFLEPLAEQTTFLEVADAVVDMANRDEAGLNAVVESLRWAEKPFDKREHREYKRIKKGGPKKKLDGGGQEGLGLLLATGYARATQRLSDPQVRTSVLERVRNSETVLNDVKRELPKLEQGFKSKLLVESEKKRQVDRSLARRIEQAASDIDELEPRFRELANRGKGKEGSWEVGVVVACSLAAWWCVVAAVVVIAVVVVVVVSSK